MKKKVIFYSKVVVYTWLYLLPCILFMCMAIRGVRFYVLIEDKDLTSAAGNLTVIGSAMLFIIAIMHYRVYENGMKKFIEDSKKRGDI